MANQSAEGKISFLNLIYVLVFNFSLISIFSARVLAANKNSESSVGDSQYFCKAQVQTQCSPNKIDWQNWCEIKRDSCIALTKKLGGELAKPEYLINCSQPIECEAPSLDKIIKSCQIIGSDKLKLIQKNLEKFRGLIQMRIQQCQGEPNFVPCLARNLPRIHLPDNFINIWKTPLSWLSQTQMHIKNELAQSCSHINKASPDYKACYFKTSIGALLESLEKPYAESPLKTTTDRLSQLYLESWSRHLEQKGCFNEKGRTIELCIFIASLGAESLELGMDLQDYINLPKLAVEGLSKRSVKEFWEKSNDQVDKELEDYVAKNKALSEAELIAEKTNAIQGLKDLQREFKKTGVVTPKLVKDLANEYSKIYKKAGFKVKLEEVPAYNSNEASQFRLHILGVKDPQQQKMLKSIHDKLEVDELFINIDRKFYDSPGESTIFDHDILSIETDAFGAQVPEHFLLNPGFFHEAHHAYYERSRYLRKDLPFYGEANFIDENKTLVSLPNYRHSFSADEIAAFRKAIKTRTALERRNPDSVYLTNANLDRVKDPNKSLQKVDGIYYREAARSVLNITTNILENWEHPQFKSLIRFQTAKEFEAEASLARIPLFDQKGILIGDYDVGLIKLNNKNSDQKYEILKSYLQQMKGEALKDFQKAEEVLKQMEN